MRLINFTIIPLLFLGAPKLNAFSGLVNSKGDPIRTVVIDAGHGGKDPGCLGSHSKEKHLALNIALHLSNLIRNNLPTINVILTRDKDEFIPLEERAAIANRNQADLFISIHCNYFVSPGTYGSETYVMGLHTSEHNLEVAKRENEAILMEDNYSNNYDYDPNSPEGHILLSLFQHAHLIQSIEFADLVEKAFDQKGRRSRGVNQAGFVVLKETTMPSVLIETGFLSNPKESQYLSTTKGQKETASAIFNAFKAYYEINWQNSSTQLVVSQPPKTEFVRSIESKASLSPSTPETISSNEDDKPNYYVQLLALSQPKEKKEFALGCPLEVKKEGSLYKYFCSAGPSVEKAREYQTLARSKGFKDAFIVTYKKSESDVPVSLK